MITRARKSIANFKLRKNMPIGAMVTLRGDRMYEFFDRLTNVAMPRVRDFAASPPGPSTAAGITLWACATKLVFPEVDYAKVDNKGHEHHDCHRCPNRCRGMALLRHLGMPFRAEGRRAAAEPRESKSAGESKAGG